MNEAAITVENISKRYRIGLKESVHDTITGKFAEALSSPFRNLSNIRRLSRFSRQENSEDIIWALKDISFNVKQGEVFGIIGKNGAGKSTLLKILSRITKPTGGTITIEGRVASLLEVGTGFHPDLTGRENVYLNGTILGMRKREIDRKFDEIVAFSGVEKFIDTPVKRYSSGMNVRLAFSVAAHLEPEILLIDEVLAVGDSGFQKKCLGKMKDVSGQGRTVLFVSHNMFAVRSLCHYAMLLQEGQLEFNGDTTECVHRYLQETLALFSNSCITWDANEAPGNEQVRILGISVKSRNNEHGKSIETTDEFDIKIRFEQLINNCKLHTSLHIKNSAGDILFGDGSGNLEEEGEIVPEEKGIYETTCTIPGHFLNSGNFYLDLLIVQQSPTMVIFRKDDIISFAVSDVPVKLGRWVHRSPGPLKPLLKWKYRKVN